MVEQAAAAVALGLLGLAGIAKLIDPAPTEGALETAGLPSGPVTTRGLGVAECLASIAGLAIGGVYVAPAGVLYLGFTVFTLAGVRQRLPIQSCGCFGQEDTPPTWAHVIYNALATISLGWVATSGGQAIPWNSPLFDLLLYLGFAVAGVYASYLLLSVMPRTLALAGSR